MNPLDISAGAVGITAPALHGIYLLLQDLQNIVDAPAAIRTLQADLRSVEQALTPLQAVTKAQWESLGEAVFTQSEAAISACATSCDKFRTQLGRWTRHSENGKLSWQDRAVIGIFKQKQIEFMSQQLQHCSLTLISVASIATLRCCLDKPQSEVAATDVTAKEDEIASTITVTDQELAVLDTSLGQLCLTKLDENDTEIDRVDAITQASATRGALDMSRKLLEDLLSGAGTVVQAGDATREQERVQNSFGGENKGIQIGTNYGSISGITFGKM